MLIPPGERGHKIGVVPRAGSFAAFSRLSGISQLAHKRADRLTLHDAHQIAFAREIINSQWNLVIAA
jgi:hypothetical protein